MKKLISIVLSLIFILAISMPATAVATKTTKLDESKAIKLKWYVIGNGQPKDAQKVQDELNKYLKTKLNLSISITCFLWGDDYE